MPGVIGPSDYLQDPPRHPCLRINSKASFFFSYSLFLFAIFGFLLFLRFLYVMTVVLLILMNLWLIG